MGSFSWLRHPLLRQCGNIYKSSLVALQPETPNKGACLTPAICTYNRAEFLNGDIINAWQEFSVNEDFESKRILYPVKERRANDKYFYIQEIKDFDIKGIYLQIDVGIKSMGYDYYEHRKISVKIKRDRFAALKVM